jgi:hypothetical protein
MVPGSDHCPVPEQQLSPIWQLCCNYYPIYYSHQSMPLPHAATYLSNPVPHAAALAAAPWISTMQLPHAATPCCSTLQLPHAAAPHSCPMLQHHVPAPCCSTRSCLMLQHSQLPHCPAPCSCPIYMALYDILQYTNYYITRKKGQKFRWYLNSFYISNTIRMSQRIRLFAFSHHLAKHISLLSGSDNKFKFLIVV